MKKLFTLFALLMAIVVGAQADSYTLGFADETVNSCNGSYAEGIATFTCGSDVFTITNTNGNKPKTNSNGNYTSDVKRYGVKYSQNVEFTVNIPDGISIKSVTFSGWSNSESAATKINKINDEDVSGSTGNSFGTKGAYDSWTYEFATAQTGSFTFVNKGAEGVFNITLTESSAPATKPTITKQPQDATYVIGTEDYPSMSVEATASAGTLKYQWHIIIPSVGDIAIPGAEASTLSLATYASSPAFAPYLSQEGSYSIYCNVADDNDNVDSDMAVITVTATAPVTPADPTFDKAAGSTIKAGEPIVITSDDGSQIYYNWSGKETGGYDEAALLGRTPKDSPASCTTSTTGKRYLYALAKKGDATSEIAIIGYTVDPNPVKGQLDKTADVVDQYADAPALPVFTVVDAAGSPSTASIGYGDDEKKDLNVKYEIADGSTEGIINLLADGSGVDYINTQISGTATVNITLTSKKNGYPLADGETGVYSYTVTVNESAPATEPSITTQPQDATYIIGSTDYPSMSVAATASAGELKYKWHIIIPSVGDIAIPDAEASTLSLADYKDMMAAYLTSPAEYDIYCVVTDDNASVNTNTAKIIVKEAADPVGGVTITEEPSDVTYTIGDADYPSMSVQATAATGEITYDWQYSADGEIFVSLASMVTSASTATLSGAEVFAALGNMIPGGQIPAGTYYVKCTLNNEGVGTDTRIASLTVKAAEPAGPPATPTFSLPAGSTIKAGESVVITSDDGSQIYYNWSGKETGGYDEAALLKRTPKDSPASCTTSTTGPRYLYALAKRGDATSEIAIIGYTVEPNPVKGQLDKTAETVDQYADAPAVPVFSLVDADGNPSPASMGAEGSTKDIFVKYVVSGTDGIITLNSDATAIESINTATAGTATATITIKQNKDGYPLIDGEGTYEYTITVNGGSTPATGLVINTQPQDVTYTIGDADYPSVTVEAEATVGTIFYDWQYSLNGNDFTSLTTMSITSASTATLSGAEVFAALGNMIPGGQIPAGTYYFKCTLTNEGTETDTRVSTLTVVDPSAVNYTKSVNIEQLVLDNGVKYDIAKEFADNYVEYANINALDSLNDADGKFQRNEPFLGLKLKASGAYIKATVKQGSTLKVKFGNIGDNVKVDINGTAQADIKKMTTKDDGYTSTIYEYTAADADAVVTFTTSSTATVVLKQIMIDEDIADVILPWAINKPATVENGTAEMPSSAYPEQQVTITATPADGYELDAITVTGASTNTAYEVDDYGTFIMPYEAVNVSVTFKQATAISGVAENEATDAANVKVIKNGKLYIGKYNVAGQRVK